ncbi:MAG TPA: DNA-3-methyladenine glycosylase [Chitinophagaceae bacterium]|nr:DNA-3-methyladenine glycosylase [Chitinophagaceae bacterium]
MPGNPKKLDRSFYDRKDVLRIARELLGKILVTQWDGVRSSGRIVETEAYAGEQDRACHAFGGRRTTRSEDLYGAPGSVYIYICYGMHHLFNVITNKKDIPHAVLIRALEPLEGVEHMLNRTGKPVADYSLTKGPGNLSRAMGMSKLHSGGNLFSEEIYIADDGLRYKKEQVIVTKRIGVEYAREDAELPYRFIVKGNPYVSAKKS